MRPVSCILVVDRLVGLLLNGLVNTFCCIVHLNFSKRMFGFGGKKPAVAARPKAGQSGSKQRDLSQVKSLIL